MCLRATSAGEEAGVLLTATGLSAEGTTRAAGLRFEALPRAPGTRNTQHATRSWGFRLHSRGDQETTLTWPDLSAIGAKERVTLEDLDANTRRNMRTSASYVFGGESRHFRVTAEPRRAAPALVTGMQLVGVGARTAGSGPRMVRFRISTEAVVDIRLLAPAGREVAMLAHRYSAVPGLNQLSWRGSLAPGLYLMEATATAEDGTATKAVQPVVVVR